MNAITTTEQDSGQASQAVQREDHRARMDDLGAYLREQQEQEFASSGWAPQAAF